MALLAAQRASRRAVDGALPANCSLVVIGWRLPLEGIVCVLQFVRDHGRLVPDRSRRGAAHAGTDQRSAIRPPEIPLVDCDHLCIGSRASLAVPDVDYESRVGCKFREALTYLGPVPTNRLDARGASRLVQIEGRTRTSHDRLDGSFGAFAEETHRSVRTDRCKASGSHAERPRSRRTHRCRNHLPSLTRNTRGSRRMADRIPFHANRPRDLTRSRSTAASPSRARAARGVRCPTLGTGSLKEERWLATFERSVQPPIIPGAEAIEGPGVQVPVVTGERFATADDDGEAVERSRPALSMAMTRCAERFTRAPLVVDAPSCRADAIDPRVPDNAQADDGARSDWTSIRR